MPQAPCGGGAVPGYRRVPPGRLRVPRRRQGEEGAGLVEGGAKRPGADAVADEVEEVAVLAGGGVGPLAGRPRGGEGATNKDRPPGAAEVAGDPVPALPAAVGEVAPAHCLGASGECRGEGGGVVRWAWGEGHRGASSGGSGASWLRLAARTGQAPVGRHGRRDRLRPGNGRRSGPRRADRDQGTRSRSTFTRAAAARLSCLSWTWREPR